MPPPPARANTHTLAQGHAHTPAYARTHARTRLRTHARTQAHALHFLWRLNEATLAYIHQLSADLHLTPPVRRLSHHTKTKTFLRPLRPVSALLWRAGLSTGGSPACTGKRVHCRLTGVLPWPVAGVHA